MAALDGAWWARRVEAGDDGAALSAPGPLAQPPVGAAWLPSRAPPTTALGVLIDNHVVPDPFIGTNATRVPDIFHAGRGFYTFWFATRFATPSSADDAPPGFFSLHFQGVNYRLQAWLNGQALAGGAGGFAEGMYLPKRADATAAMLPPGSPLANTLLLRVEPPDHVGCVDAGGQGGDHQLARDVAMQATQGWDWALPVADRNTGVWLPVALERTGAVAVRDVAVVAAVVPPPAGAAGDEGAAASVSVRATLRNVSAQPQKVRVALELLPPHGGAPLLTASVQAQLPPGESCELTLLRDATIPAPQLWWPVGLGAQPLYAAAVTVSAGADLQVSSDAASRRFGLRSLEVPFDPATGGRVFVVNGVRLFVRGANYITSDLLLRNARRTSTEVRLLAAAGLNMLRVWGGAAAESDELYDACDECGLLVWQDFWITGDCNGRGQPPAPEQAAWPEDHALFLASAAALVRRLRSRPCLALWCGGNEQRPAPDIDAALASMLGSPPPPCAVNAATSAAEVLDATRLYVPGSLWSGFAKGDGAFSDGPYTCQRIVPIFSGDAFYPYAFNPELGCAAVPVADSVRRMFPDPADAAPPALAAADGGDDVSEQPNAAWALHCFQAHGTPGAVRNQLGRYGVPAGGAPLSLDAYCERAQLVAYEQHRALLEAWGSGMWRRYTGMLLWKAHNPWPGLRSALYDYWHDVGGGYAAALAVTAAPLHAQLNAATRRVEVVRTGRAPPADGARLALAAQCYRLDGSVAWRAALELPRLPGGGGDASASVTVTDLVVPHPPGSPVYFLRLLLLSPDDAPGAPPRARSFYWLHAPRADFAPLQAWREASASPVRLELASPLRVDGAGRASATLRVANTAARVAFFLRLSLRREPPPPPPLAAEAAAPLPQQPLWRALLRALRRALGLEAAAPRGDVLMLAPAAAPPARPAEADDRVLPVFWAANYVSLVPGEALDVPFSFDVADAAQLGSTSGAKPALPRLRLQASGWNVPLVTLPLHA